MKKLVYLNEEIAPAARRLLEEKYEVVNTYDRIEEIEAIVSRKEDVTRDIISRAKNLKIISDHGTGLDQIDMEAAREYGIKVTNTPGLNAQSVAELAAGFFLALNFKMKFIDSGLQQHKFEKFGLPELNGHELYGKKLGLVGSGNIAQKLASIMKAAFNADVYCWNPRKNAEQLAAFGFKKVETLEELFSKMDLISIHIPITEETKNLINAKIFENCNPELLLVNTARGGIINEEDLYAALVSGKLRGAALDVFAQEPPAEDNPLLKLPNFIGTLHVGGSTEEALNRVGLATVQNVIDVLG